MAKKNKIELESVSQALSDLNDLRTIFERSLEPAHKPGNKSTRKNISNNIKRKIHELSNTKTLDVATEGSVIEKRYLYSHIPLELQSYIIDVLPKRAYALREIYFYIFAAARRGNPKWTSPSLNYQQIADFHRRSRRNIARDIAKLEEYGLVKRKLLTGPHGGFIGVRFVILVDKLPKDIQDVINMQANKNHKTDKSGSGDKTFYKPDNSKETEKNANNSEMSTGREGSCGQESSTGRLRSKRQELPSVSADTPRPVSRYLPSSKTTSSYLNNINNININNINNSLFSRNKIANIEKRELTKKKREEEEENSIFHSISEIIIKGHLILQHGVSALIRFPMSSKSVSMMRKDTVGVLKYAIPESLKYKNFWWNWPESVNNKIKGGYKSISFLQNRIKNGPEEFWEWVDKRTQEVFDGLESTVMRMLSEEEKEYFRKLRNSDNKKYQDEVLSRFNLKLDNLLASDSKNYDNYS